MKIGDFDLSRDDAWRIAQSYAALHGDTVLYYDLGGDLKGSPGADSGAEPVDGVTLADLGRLVVFNAQLRANDVATLMTLEINHVLDPAVLPPDARLEDWGSGTPWDDAATAAYDAFRPGPGSGIQRAKRSKLLHLKRPWLVPIHDSRIDAIYSRAALQRGRSQGGPAAYWEVIREDLVAGCADLEWLSGQLADSDDATQRRMGQLTSLRLLDVLAWSLDKERAA